MFIFGISDYFFLYSSLRLFTVKCYACYNRDTKYFKHFALVYSLFISQLREQTTFSSPKRKLKRDTRTAQKQSVKMPLLTAHLTCSFPIFILT